MIVSCIPRDQRKSCEWNANFLADSARSMESGRCYKLSSNHLNDHQQSSHKEKRWPDCDGQLGHCGSGLHNERLSYSGLICGACLAMTRGYALECRAVCDHGAISVLPSAA
jgi:hypothetical protein